MQDIKEKRLSENYGKFSLRKWSDLEHVRREKVNWSSEVESWTLGNLLFLPTVSGRQHK